MNDLETLEQLDCMLDTRLAEFAVSGKKQMKKKAYDVANGLGPIIKAARNLSRSACFDEDLKTKELANEVQKVEEMFPGILTELQENRSQLKRVNKYLRKTR